MLLQFYLSRRGIIDYVCCKDQHHVCFSVATLITVTRGGFHQDVIDIVLAIRLTLTRHVRPRVHRVNTGLR